MLETVDATMSSTEALLRPCQKQSDAPRRMSKAVGFIPILLTEEDINASYYQGDFLLWVPDVTQNGRLGLHEAPLRVPAVPDKAVTG